MTYLLDTNILSEPTKQLQDAKAMAWLERNQGEWCTSSVALAEVRFGIVMLPDGKRRIRLETWFEEVVETVPALAWDTGMAIRWADIVATTRKRGLNLGIKDTMIAACAIACDLTVATRNVDDFTPTGARVVNPYA
jgi:predicted nucleic acid-binding protein